MSSINIGSAAAGQGGAQRDYRVPACRADQGRAAHLRPSQDPSLDAYDTTRQFGDASDRDARAALVVLLTAASSPRLLLVDRVRGRARPARDDATLAAPPRARARACRTSIAGVGRGRGRSRDRRGALRAERLAPARARVEREARADLRAPGDARARRSGSRRRCSAIGHSSRERRLRRAICPRGRRRPDADEHRPARARAQRARGRDPPDHRRRPRRRVALRRDADVPRLEAVLLHQRVAAALGARRRPRVVPRLHGATSGEGRGAALPRRAPRGRGRRRRQRRRTGDAARQRRPAREDALGAARRASSRFMDLHSDNFTAEHAAQAARR